METITIDGMDEHDFRHEVEDLLRLDQGDEALARLRVLLEPYAGGGMFLPARFLDVTAADVRFTGLDKLEARLSGYDRPGYPISAIGVVLADARVLGGPGPKHGRLAPFIKTYYFSDDAYPFTEASRDDLLDGYSREGFGWQADYQATDATLRITGIDDLHGAIIELEDKLLDRAEPPEEAVRAGSIGACYLAALIHQALREAVRKQGLPRPLCVLAACDGVYPFFDAPVAGWDECGGAPVAEARDEVWPSALEEADGDEGPGPVREGSLLSIVSRKGTKHLALAIGEDDAREAARFTEEASAQRLVIEDAALKGLFHGVPVADLGAFDRLDRGASVDHALDDGFEAEGEGEDGFAAEVEADFDPLRSDDPAEPVFADEPFESAEPPEAEPLLAAPTGHSLRERFRAVEPVEAGGAAGFVGRLVGWLRGLLPL